MNIFTRHARFLTALASGAAVSALAPGWSGPTRALLGVNGFFLVYLVLTLRLALVTSPADLKRHAADDDEGIALILLLAIVAVIISLTAIFWVLNSPISGKIDAAAALTAVPLGWGTVHTLMAFRYSHLFYGRHAPGGLRFPETPLPGVWDFLYFSFGVGMTAQVADVVITKTPLRRVVLCHAVAAFFYNAIILALAVNAGLALAS